MNRNIILISVDTLRPDFLECYGAPYGASPVIDRLAEEGLLFEQAYSVAPWTLPSHVTMMTGLFPTEHGVNPDSPSEKVLSPSPEIPMLAEILQQNHYETAAFTGGAILGKDYGFGRGFDVCRTSSLFYYTQIEQAKQFIESRNAKRQFFIFIHTWEVHDYFRECRGMEGFSPPLPGMEGYSAPLPELKQTYIEKIASMDSRLAEFFRALQERGYQGNTLIILTSDHGEGFNEHNLLCHSNSLYNELLRVPLIMAGPGLPAHQRIASPVSMVDLMPTTLEWAGIEISEEMQGRSLLEIERQLTNTKRNTFIFSENEVLPMYSIITDKYKYINYLEQERELLFDLVSDPKETLNLAEKRPIILHESRLTAKEFRKNLKPHVPRHAELGEDLANRLKALGYIQ